MRRLLLTIILLLALAGTGRQAIAASPWQWEVTMQQSQTGTGMHLPSALHIDAVLERYYVVDSGNNRILTFDRVGGYYRSFDAAEQLHVPFDLVREEGILWIVEKGKNSLTKIDLEAKKIYPNTLSADGKKIYPDRLEVEKKVLYILDKASGNVFALDANLNITSRFSCPGCDIGFVDFKIRNGSLWALEQGDKKVYRFAMNGSLQGAIQLDKNAVDFPRSLEVDENGFLYVLDRHQGSIAVFDGSGGFRYSFLEPGEARGMLYYPIELKFDPWGRLCVVDEGNGRVQIFSRR